MDYRFTAVLCSWVCCGSLVFAQAGGGSKPEFILPTPTKTSSGAISGTLGEVYSQIKDQNPIVRAGLRASILRQVQATIPTVVIVGDADSYLYAISMWEGVARFPVLWDDGSVQSREDIARFVRGFAPERVIRVSGKPDEAWGGDREKKQRIFERALSKAIDESRADWQDSLAALHKDGIVSPGIVVGDVEDSAWAAALALCAGRLEPILFVNKPTPSVYKQMNGVEGDALERAIERGAEASGRSWDQIGDDIDAITVAMNTGTLIKTGPGARDRLATTDRIGRRGSNGSGERWAWSGQIIGNESRGVYQAMCALFLSIDQAFVWDGYTQSPPWGTYDGTAAGAVLTKAGLEVEIHDLPRNTLHDWKQRMVRVVGRSPEAGMIGEGTAQLILMNSKGASNYFDLPGVPGGQGKAGQVPMLGVPAALHIVHSFSLQYPMNRNTVGGRFLERGVYVYAGSVDEPYLGGFVPTPAIAKRLSGSMSFAAAVHFDDGKVWKIAVLGDPLVTIGPAGRRVDGKVEIDGGVDIDARSKQRLKEGAYEGAIEDLVMLGKDEAVARLAIALMKEKPAAVSPGVAMASLPSLFRVGEYTKLLDAYERLDSAGRVEPLMQDLLWLSSPYLLARSSSNLDERGRIEALLRHNLRKGQKIQDAEDLAMAMRRRSVNTAVGVLEALRPTLNEKQKKMLDRAIKRVRK